MKSLLVIMTILMASVLLMAACSAGAEQSPAADVEQKNAAQSEEVWSAEPTPKYTLTPYEAENTDQEEDMTKQSSYAHMRLFDPKTGIAQFDYFEILTGFDAIDYLINCEGFCSLEAETQVAEYGEGDYLEANSSRMVIPIDLTDVPLKLLYKPDGSRTQEAVDAAFEDIAALYETNRGTVLLSHYYYITVDEDTGKVLLIEQIEQS